MNLAKGVFGKRPEGWDHAVHVHGSIPFQTRRGLVLLVACLLLERTEEELTDLVQLLHELLFLFRIVDRDQGEGVDIGDDVNGGSLSCVLGLRGRLLDLLLVPMPDERLDDGRP